MTFLELVRKVAQESGTASNAVPTSVVNQGGQVGKLVGWVADAWEDIQLLHNDWRWMETEYSDAMGIGQRNYAPSDLGIADRFGAWIFGRDTQFNMLEVFQPFVFGSGKPFEKAANSQYIPYREFRTRFKIGPEPITGVPKTYTLRPDDRLSFEPVPDKEYLLSGLYRKSPQILEADDDVPECPAQFHNVISDLALTYVAMDEEASFQMQTWERRYKRRLRRLENDQRPRILLGQALA